MADLTDEQREQNRVKRLRREKRSLARDQAQAHAARAIDALLVAETPEWFDADQVHAYAKELERLRERITGTAYRG
jgi:hypothetical protein